MNFEQPYRATRSPVCASNVVATSQPLATQAGIDALRRGGNAVDAAISAAITLTVVEPCMNGVGSDAFALIWQADQLHGLNGSGRSPAAWTAERFSRYSQMPEQGWDSITVPGAVDAWASLSKSFGQLDFKDLFTNAIHYAQHGFQVGPVSAKLWQQADTQFSHFADFAEHFLPAPAPGTTVRRPALAKTLEDIADSHGESFYRGRLAEKIVAASNAADGVLSLDDMAQHASEWVSPIHQTYADVALYEIPPNGQGLAALIALAILDELPPAPLDSADAVHMQIEAMKIAIRAAFDHIADPQTMQISTEQLLDQASIRRAAASITHAASPLPPKSLPTSEDTVYLCAADASGLMVSFIQSNYMGFGSGIVVPDTGIAMQNRAAGFTLIDGHPNQVAGGKRPFHTIIPGFVTQAGKADMAFGVMGGHMQAQGHVQMMTRIYTYNQNPQAASDAPRWIVYPDFTIGLEPGHDPTILEDLASRGHNVRFDPTLTTWGGAQLIKKFDSGYIAGSDHRKEGCAAGF